MCINTFVYFNTKILPSQFHKNNIPPTFYANEMSKENVKMFL